MADFFAISELVRSNEAAKRGIDNTPSPEVEIKLLRLIESLLDPIRELWGAPITVNSGFRSAMLNVAVGGAKTSQHLRGEAADITTGGIEKNKQLFKMIKESGLPFDQLIDERGYRWLHVSYSANNRNQTLHL